MSGTFYLHEDDWGMSELLPIENMAGREKSVEEARQFGEKHFDSKYWTDVYLIPEAAHSIAERQIHLDELRALLGSWLSEADTVQSGYSTQTETFQHSFAFKGSAPRSGAFYGNYEGDLITQLNLIRPIVVDVQDAADNTRFAEALGVLGQRHRLFLADWWTDRIVDLQDQAAIANYLRDDEDEGDVSEPTAES